MSKINESVAAYRKFRCLTQGELAEKLGLKASTYAMRERKGEISAKMLSEVAEALEVDLMDLLNCVPPPKQKQPLKTKEQKEEVSSLTTRELNLLKTIHYFKKTDKKEVFDFVDKKYQEYMANLQK